MTKVRLNIAFFVVVALSAIVFLTGGFATQKAYAVGGTLNQTLCERFPGPGVWNVDTCTITSAITINSGETLIIPSGITLKVPEVSGSSGIFNHGTIDNSGTLSILNSGGPASVGIHLGRGGTITNTGTLSITLFAGRNGGILNDGGTIDNSGTLTVGNGGETVGIVLTGGGTTDNSGTLNVSNIGSGPTISIRLFGDGTIDNSGTLNVGSSGTIANSGTINNPGTINNFCGTIINNGIFTGNPVNNLCDSDSDGI